MIRVTGLTLRVPQFSLRDVTFVVPAGGIGVVTGPTGAGKTTLLETIAGVRRAASGQVQLGERDVTALPPEHRSVGLVYQQAWLFPHLSVHANVTYGATNDDTVAALIALLRLDPLLDKPVETLSGGERQLVALARALAREPQTLLLDEPFAAMDARLRGDTRTAVLDWSAARACTTLLVTHDAAEAQLAGGVQLRIDAGTVTVRPGSVAEQALPESNQ